MSKEHPARAAGPPGRPALPPEAEQEIMDMLSANMRISSGEIAAILKKHGVSGDADALQDSYRKRLGQRLMSSIRDENGRREVLARGSEYIVVECCSDQQALEQSQQNCESLWLTSNEQQEYTNFLSHKAEALRDALEEFCPRLSTPEDMKRFYDTISPSMDAQGFTLYRTAKELTGIDVPSLFPYEDNRGMFELMEGHQLLDWLIAVRFQAVEWEIIPGSTYESAALLEVDATTPEYQAFEQQLYGKVLSRMGFDNILGPEQEAGAIESKVMELKLYSPLTANLYMEPDPDSQGHEDGTEQLVELYGEDLTEYKNIILQAIEDEMLQEMEEQGLMFAFSGSNALSEKVLSLFLSVEEMDGVLCGVAVCQIKEMLTPAELEELKEFCTSQYADGWGEGYAQRPRHTEDGELYVNFWQDNNFSILTKEELETAKAASRPPRQPKRGGDAR